MVGLTAQWLHANHVLGTGERQLNDLEDGLAHTCEGRDAGGEGDEQNVEPGDEEGDGPGEEP